MNESDPELPEKAERIVRRLAATDPLETHPSAAALVSFDEDPSALSARTVKWIEAHLETCTACRRARTAVPRLGPAARPARRTPWIFAAAAGWLLAAFLGLRGRDLGPAPDWALPPVQTVVLSTTRGGQVPSVPPATRILRCELVLGEEIELGALLHVRIVDAGGRTAVEEDRRVEERNERDWPVLTLDRAALPPGKVQLEVRTPSGLQATFELSL